MVAETVPKRGPTIHKTPPRWGSVKAFVVLYTIVAVTTGCLSSWLRSESAFPMAADIVAARRAQSRAQDCFVQMMTYASNTRHPTSPTVPTRAAALQVAQNFYAVPPSVYAVGTVVGAPHKLVTSADPT